MSQYPPAGRIEDGEPEVTLLAVPAGGGKELVEMIGKIGGGFIPDRQLAWSARQLVFLGGYETIRLVVRELAHSSRMVIEAFGDERFAEREHVRGLLE